MECTSPGMPSWFLRVRSVLGFLSHVRSLSHHGNTLLTYLTLSHSCDYNLKDQSGCTPLHIAVKYNKEEVVKVLVHRGASIAIKDNKEKTPLHYCMELVSYQKYNNLYFFYFLLFHSQGHTGCGRVIQTLSSR